MLDNEGVRFLDDMTAEEFKQRLGVQGVRAEFVRNAQETIDALRSLTSPGEEVMRPEMALRIQAR
ncbi:MAG: hypothetical protein NVSMB33_18290 [Ktedonobacteraceae bacterium]